MVNGCDKRNMSWSCRILQMHAVNSTIYCFPAQHLVIGGPVENRRHHKSTVFCDMSLSSSSVGNLAFTRLIPRLGLAGCSISQGGVLPPARHLVLNGSLPIMSLCDGSKVVTTSTSDSCRVVEAFVALVWVRFVLNRFHTAI